MSDIKLRCRKCRSQLNEDCNGCVVSVHSEPLNTTSVRTSGKCQETADVFYLKDSNMPKWIVNLVDEAGWCKGKLMCPHCSARLGSFDFVSGSKCACNNFVLPPIHLVKSKVDYNVI